MELQHREAREIGHARRQRGRGRDAAQIVHTDRAPLAARQAPCVAPREPGVRERWMFDQRGPHAERIEDVRADVRCPRHPTDRRHHLARDDEREVGVLPAILRREHGRLRGYGGADRVDRRELEIGPVRKRRLTREASRVCEDVAERDGRSVRVRRGRREPRQMVAHLVVEAELARVPELQDRGGGERLRDRGHPVQRLRRGIDLPSDVRPAESSRPHDVALVDDGDRESGPPAIGELPLDPGAQQIDIRSDIGMVEREGGHETPLWSPRRSCANRRPVRRHISKPCVL